MKKLLSLFGLTSLMAVTSSQAIACGSKENNDDFDEDETQNLQLIRNEFIATVRQIIESHASSTSQYLYLTEDISNQKTIFNSTWLETLELLPGEQNFSLTAGELMTAKSEIDSMLNISANLNTSIRSVVDEDQRFDFLTLGFDSIFTKFDLRNNMKIEKKLIGNQSENFVYTIKFEIDMEFQYIFNGSVEFEQVHLPLLITISSDSALIENIKAIQGQLAHMLYEKHSALFQFDEVKLGLSKSVFKSQANNVFNYFRKPENETALNDAIANTISSVDNLGIPDVSLSYDTSLASSMKRLFSKTMTHVIKTGGFIEHSMFNKFPESTSPELKAEAFASEFGTNLGASQFATREETVIFNELNVSLNTNDAFVEYGKLVIDNLIITVSSDITVAMNPISLFYSYNPIEGLDKHMDILFKNWQEQWGIVTSNDRNALFKISNASDLAADIWTKIGQSLYHPFDEIIKDKPKFFNPSLEGTGFDSFYLDSETGGHHPYPTLNSQGYQVNYSGFSLNPSDSQKSNSWKLQIFIDDLRININFVRNPDYFENVWLGTRAGRFLIER